MPLIAVGLNHTTAPLALRERVSFSPDSIGVALQALRDQTQGFISEAAIVSTCNRTELYCAVSESGHAHASGASERLAH